MKKITTLIISGLFVFTSVFADSSTNIGLRISMADMSASGTETTNTATSVVQKEKTARFEMPSIFVERFIDTGAPVDFAVGLDLVPLTAEIDRLGGSTGHDTTIKASNLITAYIQPMFAVNEKISVFGKVGYSSGTLLLVDTKRQLTTGSLGAASTDNPDKKLEGPVYGLGVHANNLGLLSFVRMEATRTEFDRISHTNSNGKKLTASSEMDLITLTLGKSF